MDDTPLIEVLEQSRRLGFLGARPIPEVIEHARAFTRALAPVRGSVVDLGAGGGVPGLVIAWDRPDLAVTLVDRRTKRTDFLERMVRRLDLKASVLAMDVAVLVERSPAHFDAATARGFGPPELTLGYGSRLVRPGGLIVISEPPADIGHDDRWEGCDLDELGVERLSAADDRGPVVVFARASSGG